MRSFMCFFSCSWHNIARPNVVHMPRENGLLFPYCLLVILCDVMNVSKIFPRVQSPLTPTHQHTFTHIGTHIYWVSFVLTLELFFNSVLCSLFQLFFFTLTLSWSCSPVYSRFWKMLHVYLRRASSRAR